jgi:hypothetical protein
VLPCVPRLWTPHLCLGGVRRCHVSQGSEPRTSAKEGSGTARCPKAPDPATLPRRGLVLPRVPRLWTLHLRLGGVRHYHMSHALPRALGHRDKERLSYNGTQQGSRVSKAHPHIAKAPTRRVGRRCYHDLNTMQTHATAPRYSASPHS